MFFIILLLLGSPSYAGVNFSMLAENGGVEVRENETKSGDRLYAELLFCTAIVVNKRTMVHLYPRHNGFTKHEVLEGLLDFIFKDDDVEVIPSGKIPFEEDIQLQDILGYLKHRGVKHVEVYDKPMDGLFRYVVVNNHSVSVVDMANNFGATVYAGMEPIRR